MKKLKMLFILLVLPFQIVNAENNKEELNINLDCPKKVGPKSNITCNISTKSDIPLNGIKIKIICKNKNRTVVEYALNKSDTPIGVSTYQMINDLPEKMKNLLPSPEEIMKRLEEFE